MKSIPASVAESEAAARALGYPVIVKASAGGGGKGMRIVCEEKDLKPALEAGMREAKSAFGDESVYLEKYLEEPRHVEFQVLADNFGNTVHLFERECSIQRRHQKIVEETPSPALDEELRAKMGKAAKKAMRAAGYNNAGTVEFLLDKNREFYLLQVEHPVTELVTGVDLVRQQILAASEERLSLAQEDLRQRGHAMECRIYAEDPANNFLPSAGKILFFNEPKGPGVRHDGGIYSGWEVPIYYDPILAKLIVWAENRETACRRMASTLEDYVIIGIHTTIEFLKDVVDHPEFRAGHTNTGFIKRYFDGWREKEKSPELTRIALAIAAYDEHSKTLQARNADRSPSRHDFVSPWQTLGKWRIGGT
jgi:acetyl/propionyl-CoA carboxylase alpha subunit